MQNGPSLKVNVGRIGISSFTQQAFNTIAKAVGLHDRAGNVRIPKYDDSKASGKRADIQAQIRQARGGKR